MKAMILAAGRGERLRPLTDDTPKPLLKVGGKCLIDYHLTALAACGISQVVINVSHLADHIQSALGDGRQYGMKIHYSIESTPLETGGGIIQALPLLGKDPFIVLNGDVWTDYPLAQLQKPLTGAAHLILVTNPAHHVKGDYCLGDDQIVRIEGEQKLTFSGMGIYHPDLFSQANVDETPRLPTLLAPAIQQGLVTGEHYQGRWIDIGTLERLEHARSFFVV